MFKKSSPNRGFSFVELLIIITIISVLAGIILVAMNPAREQAKEARISSDLVQLQSHAEILYLDEGNYSKIDCLTGPPEIIALCDDVADQGSLVQIFPTSPLTQEYCASAILSTGEEFCVDYQGFADRVISSSCSSFPYLCVVSSSPTVDLKANGSDALTITEGVEELILDWITTNSPDSCTASGNWSGVKDPAGGTESQGFPLAGSYTYTIECTNAVGSGSDSVAVTVDPPAPPICSGPNNPSTLVNVLPVTRLWINPENAATSDNIYTDSTLFSFNAQTDYIQATNFGFSIPLTATINGIQVEVERFASLGGFRDMSIRLVQGGVISGNDNIVRATGLDWPVFDPNTYVSYGNSTDLWGLTWTPSDINDPNFGVVYRAWRTSTAAETKTGFIDHIRMTVCYSEPLVPDFSISASPTTIKAPQTGTSQTSTITITSLNGFNSAVTLSVSSGLPAGATANFNPNPITPPPDGTVTSDLTIDTLSASPGSYALTIQGQNGAITKTTTVTLEVVDLSVSLTANPSSGTEPLNNVDLTAIVSGSATGTINYKFDCTDDGVWDLEVNNSTLNPFTAVDLCNYSTAGTKTARVLVERDVANPAEDTTTITVDLAPPLITCYTGIVVSCQPETIEVAAPDCASAGYSDTPSYFTVFVTSSFYSGNLGGTSGADLECNNVAAAAGLPGTYTAWISQSSTTGPADRGLASCAAAGASSVEWRETDGTTVIANNWADLTDGTIDNNINRTETGSGGCSVGWVWTCTLLDGTAATCSDIWDCKNWSSPEASSTGIHGFCTSTGSTWTNSTTNTSCGGILHLYCFQSL